MIKIKFIGTGRCGTRYASKLCQASGYDVGHEVMGADGISSSRPDHVAMEAELSVLLVREPVACVSSLTTLKFSTFRWFSRKTGCYLGTDVVRMACEHYATWNLMLKKHATRVVQIECLSLVDLGLTQQPLHSVPKNVNSRKHEDLTLEHLKSTTWGQQALAVGRKFGYAY